MTNVQLRLGFAAILASVTITSSVQAQAPLNDSNTSGVLVSLRPQSGLLISQENPLKSTALDAGKPSSEDQVVKQDDPSKKEAEQGDQEKDNEDARPSQSSDGGRLTPIAMESVRAPIGAANISVMDIGTKVLPEDQAAKQMTPRLPLPGGRDRALAGLTYRWQAANICHLPLYFEEPMLERHGQQCCPTWIQPAVSGSKFLSNLILYPYKATLHPAFENRYTLGHFRPGSGAPCLRDSLPWSADAALVQAGAATAVVVGLPW